MFAGRRLSIRMTAIWLALPSLLAFLEVSLAADHPIDFWLHVNTGRLISQTGSLAGRDEFTCTIAGSEVVNQNWLAELVTYGLYRIGGFELCQFAAAACYAAAIGLAVRLSFLRCRQAHAAAIAGLAGLGLAVSNFGIRPQAISALLFAGELFALWRGAGRMRTIAWVALVEMAWTNMHGAFVLGVILPGIFLVTAGWRQIQAGEWRAVLSDRNVKIYLACVLVAALAMFANPQPSRTLDYVFHTSSKSVERGIAEWLPTTFATFTGKALFAALAALTCLFGSSRRRLEPEELLLLSAFLLLAAQAQRMVIWFALILPPIVAPQIAHLLRAVKLGGSKGEEHDETPWLALALVLSAILTTLPWTRSYNPLLPAAKRTAAGVHEPAGAVEFLRNSKYRGNVFAPVSWGAYLTCFLYPDVKVFNDSRIESFTDEVWNDYLQIGAARGDWNAALDKYGIDAVVWSDRLSPALLISLECSPRWEEAFRNAQCAVFRRRGSASPSTMQVAR